MTSETRHLDFYGGLLVFFSDNLLIGLHFVKNDRNGLQSIKSFFLTEKQAVLINNLANELHKSTSSVFQIKTA